jgi:hypothetical protein
MLSELEYFENMIGEKLKTSPLFIVMKLEYMIGDSVCV